MERAEAAGRSDLIFEKRTPGVNPLRNACEMRPPDP
jgi:hypothetical protein